MVKMGKPSVTWVYGELDNAIMKTQDDHGVVATEKYPKQGQQLNNSNSFELLG